MPPGLTSRTNQHQLRGSSPGESGGVAPNSPRFCSQNNFQ